MLKNITAGKITEQEVETLDLEQPHFTATADDLYTTEQLDRHLEESDKVNSARTELHPAQQPNAVSTKRRKHFSSHIKIPSPERHQDWICTGEMRQERKQEGGFEGPIVNP
jgi:hypothetical protein